MIDIYPTRIEAVDEDQNILFVLSTEDAQCCTMHIKSPILLSKQNLEQTLTAIRRGVHMLELED
jgi:hypothetical protein